jgi:hypothetical protein
MGLRATKDVESRFDRYVRAIIQASIGPWRSISGSTISRIFGDHGAAIGSTLLRSPGITKPRQ